MRALPLSRRAFVSGMLALSVARPIPGRPEALSLEAALRQLRARRTATLGELRALQLARESGPNPFCIPARPAIPFAATLRTLKAIEAAALAERVSVERRDRAIALAIRLSGQDYFAELRAAAVAQMSRADDWENAWPPQGPTAVGAAGALTV